jgi:hypothetical protein
VTATGGGLPTPRAAPVMQVSDFEMIRPISRGAYGRVYEVRKKASGARAAGGCVQCVRVCSVCVCVCTRGTLQGVEPCRPRGRGVRHADAAVTVCCAWWPPTPRAQ